MACSLHAVAETLPAAAMAYDESHLEGTPSMRRSRRGDGARRWRRPHTPSPRPSPDTLSVVDFHTAPRLLQFTNERVLVLVIGGVSTTSDFS